MIFRETPLRGAFVIDVEIRSDERGFFGRTYCEQEFAAHGLAVRWVQCNLSGNVHAGTLRGMHYQVFPHAEAKLVRCSAGRLYDVIIDLRAGSPSYLQHFGIELSARNHTMLYIPEGLAHGFQVLEDHTEMFYQMSAFYNPESARGVRWDDPLFGIRWPIETRIISDRDQAYPDFQPA
ncbi:dTDP-4-dehydrorhamnose 3,5-epimerase [Nitrospira sp.]|nr:dTDP-4-dehydrorhamnose 3,5-epimerase [Nitrospira sp.]